MVAVGRRFINQTYSESERCGAAFSYRLLGSELFLGSLPECKTVVTVLAGGFFGLNLSLFYTQVSLALGLFANLCIPLAT